MSSFKEHFEIPAKYRTWSMALMGIGVVSVMVGFFMYGTKADEAKPGKVLGHHAAEQHLFSADLQCCHVLYLCYYSGHGCVSDGFPPGDRSHFCSSYSAGRYCFGSAAITDFWSSALYLSLAYT